MNTTTTTHAAGMDSAGLFAVLASSCAPGTGCYSTPDNPDHINAITMTPKADRTPAQVQTLRRFLARKYHGGRN